MSDNEWIDEARIRARLCWRDETTQHLIMEPALVEVIAQAIASWMETAATYSKNADYWRGKVPPNEDKILGEYAAVAILPPLSDESVVNHADAYANRCAEHAYCAAQAAASTANTYAEFAKIAKRDKIVGYSKFARAALYAKVAASAASRYADAAAKASTVYLAMRAKFDVEYAAYLARPAVQMPNAIPEAEAEAAIADLIKVADAAIELHQK